MTDISKYEKLRQVISERLEALGFKHLETIDIHIVEGEDTVISFTVEMTKKALLSAEEKKMLTDFNDIIKGLDLNTPPGIDHPEDGLEEGESYDPNDWDL